MTDATQCAENLPYGPNSITQASSPYVSTQFRSMLHDAWQQVLTTTSGTTLHITWQFSNVKTLEERFQSAVTSGEAVSWTIRYSAAGSTHSKSGTWRFSSTAGDMLARFASSGSSFSSNKGLWGGGTGTVDGDVGYASDFWGHGNGQSSDNSCGSVYLGSSSVSSSLRVSGNLMYIGSGELLLGVYYRQLLLHN